MILNTISESIVNMHFYITFSFLSKATYNKYIASLFH